MGDRTQSLCCLAAARCERGPAVRRRAGFREESVVVIAVVGVCACECVRGACAVCAALCMAAWRAGWIPVLLKESGVIHVDGDTENSLSRQPLGVQLPYHDNVKL